MNDYRAEDDNVTSASSPAPAEDAAPHLNLMVCRALRGLRRLALATLVVCTVLIAWSPTAAHARVVSWTGGGADDRWTTNANWAGIDAPDPGDDLIFPDSAIKRGTANDFPAGTTFGSITFSGDNYRIGGNSFVLQRGITASKSSNFAIRIVPQIALAQNQTFTINSGASLQLAGGVVMDIPGTNQTAALFLQDNGRVEMGSVSGSFVPGGLVKSGSGTTVLLQDSPGLKVPVAVTRGALVLTTPGGLGSTTEGTEVSAGATLFVEMANPGAPTTIAEPLILRGGGLTDVLGALFFAAGTVTYTGPISLGSESTAIGVGEDRTLTLTGALTNATNTSVVAGLVKVSDGALVVNANATYAGKTVVHAGTLVVNGSQPASTIELESGGRLAGIGTVGPISGAKGVLVPGAGSQSTIGTLTMSSLDLTSQASYIYEVQATGQDRLVVNGTVNLGGAPLGPVISVAPTVGTILTVVQKNSVGPIVGTFKNLPEGATLVANNQTFRISYVGGNGNDVTLTRSGAANECANRPKVSVQTAKDGPGRLKVTVTVGTQPAFPTNRLSALHFLPGANALVDVNGQTGLTGDVRIPLQNQPVSTTFVVRRATAGQVTQLPLIVEDGCGEWKTFVGGGPAAF
jgi:autotransporter-associated beta strand protein